MENMKIIFAPYNERIVHPEIFILSPFTHSHCCMFFLSLAEHKEKIKSPGIVLWYFDLYFCHCLLSLYEKVQREESEKEKRSSNYPIFQKHK